MVPVDVREVSAANDLALLEAIYQHAPIGLAALDLNLRFLRINDRLAEMNGPPAAAHIGRTMREIVPVLANDLERLARQVLATGEPARDRPLSGLTDAQPGVVRHWVEQWFPLHDASGTIIGLNIVVEEVTERIRAEEALRVAQRRAVFLSASSAALAESLDPEAVLRTIAKLAVGTAAEPGLADACVVTLATPEEASAGRWRTFIEGIDPNKVALEIERRRRFPAQPGSGQGAPAVILSGHSELVTPDMMEQRLRRIADADPEHWSYFQRVDLYSVVSAPLVARGRTTGALTLVRHGPVRRAAFDADDLALVEELARRAAVALDNARLYATAERSRAESASAHADAVAARATAETANRAKSDFLAVMSHELRTPLNAIGGYAELLELGIRGPVNPQQREDLHRIQTSQRHLLGLINEVLNYAKLETGSARFDIGEVPVNEALLAAEALIAPQAQARGLTLYVCECLPSTDGRPISVRADPEKVRQILVNLLSNAVKFTDEAGRIELECEVHEDLVRIAVRDTGIGIAADQLERIFEPFVQVLATLTRTSEGVGLGLAISRDLARGMGGDLAVESMQGSGSTFTLTLPRV